MAVTVVLNGVSYALPDPGDSGWGQSTTDYLVAQATGLLQKAGGAFTLTAEVDFGATYGLKSTYFKSRGPNPATVGQVRLANNESIVWRNAANGANLGLKVNASDLLEYNGTAIQPVGNYITALTGNVAATGPGSVVATIQAGVIVNSMVSNSAAIDYAKLALTGSIVNADVNASAAIAYSKLALTGSIVNADVNASAAIAYSKLALTGSIINADVNASAAIAYSKLALTGSIVNADVATGAAIARSKTATGTAYRIVANDSGGVMSENAALTASRALASDANGQPVAATTTTTELNYVNGVTSAIQTQLDAKQARATLTTKGDLYVATASATVARQAIGTDGQVLTADSAQTNGLKWATPTAATTYAIATKTGNYTVDVTDYCLLGDATGGGFTFTLPAAASNSGRVFQFKKLDSSANIVTVDGNASETIDGATTYTLTIQYESITIISDGTSWYIF